MHRRLLYLAAATALVVNVGVELTHLPGRLDVALEISLFSIMVIALIFLRRDEKGSS